MSDYEEVVSLVADINQFGKDLNDAAARYGTFLKQIEVLGNDVNLIDLNKKWLQPLLDKQEAMAKINADILKADEKLANDQASVNDRSIAAQLQKIKDKAATQVAINKDANNVIIKEDEDAASTADRLIAQQLKVREQVLADEARMHMAAIANWIRTEEEAAITEEKLWAATARTELRNYEALQEGKIKVQAAASGDATLARGLRAGAGAAAGAGSFQASGALYGAANVSQMLGIGSLEVSTAGLVALGGAAALAGGAIYEILGPGAEFNQELAKMSTLLVDANVSAADFNSQLDKTAHAAVEISDKFNIGLIDVVKQFKLALSSGIEADELPAFFDKAGELSNALGTSLEHTTDILTTFKNVYSLTASELGHVNDVLFNTINLGKIEVDGFTKNLGRVLPIAKNAGIGIEDLGTAYAVLTSKGVTAAQSTTGLTQFISAMVNPTAKAQKEFDALGIATGDAAFQGKALIDVIKEINEKTGGSADVLGKLFPEERAKRVVSFLVDSTDKFKQFGEGIRQSGTDAIASGRAMNDLSDNLGKLWKTASNFATFQGAKASGWLNKLIFGDTSAGHAQDVADTKAQLMTALGSIYTEMNRNHLGAGGDGDADISYGGTNDMSARSKAFVDGVRNAMQKYLENLGYSHDYTDNAKLIESAIGGAQSTGQPNSAKVLDDSQKALNGINQYLDDIQRKVNDTSRLLAQLPQEQKLTKNESKELAAKETDEQKQQLLDLHETNDELQVKITREAEVNKILEEREIKRLQASILTPAADSLSDAQKTGDPYKIQAATKAYADAKLEFDAAVTKVTAEAAEDDITTRLKAESQGIIDQIAKIESEALTSPTTRASRQASKTEAEKELREYQQTVKQIYDDDQRAFEKSEKEKEKIQKDALTAMQRENDRYTNSESSITKEMLQSKLKTGDPDRQRYTATEARDAARAKLEGVVASGGDKDEFTKAMQEFKDAAQAVQDAMIAAGYDKDRAHKNFQGDLGFLSQEDSQYHTGATDAISKREAAQTRASSYNRKSPEEIAKEAAGQVKKDEAVKEVLVKAQVQLQVDGTLSPQTLKTIQDALIDKIEERIVNKSGNPSRYDSSNRGPSTQAAPSTSRQHDNSNEDDDYNSVMGSDSFQGNAYNPYANND